MYDIILYVKISNNSQLTFMIKIMFYATHAKYFFTWMHFPQSDVQETPTKYQRMPRKYDRAWI